MAVTDLIDPNTFLKARTALVEEVLTKSHYVIPKYQRPFSWGQDQFSELWNDLSETAARLFFGENPKSGDIVPHFMGAIVLEQAEDAVPEVMDGQQRLVTFSIIVSVLQEFAAELGEEDRKNITGTLEKMLFDYSISGKIPRIQLSKDDVHFQELVVGSVTQDARRAYKEAQGPIAKNSVLAKLFDGTEFFWIRINEFIGTNPENRPKNLKTLIRSVLQLSIFLTMTVREQGVAYEVFEGLNARGLDLQQSDLLKNRLFSLASNQGTDKEVDEFWRRVEGSIENQSWVKLTEFLYFQFVGIHSGARQKTFYSTVKEFLVEKELPAANYAKLAADSASSLESLLDAGSGFAERTQRMLKDIRDALNVRYVIPILLAGAHRHHIESAEMAEVIRLAHNFTFRRFLVENAGLATFSKEAVELAQRYASGDIGSPKELSTAMKGCSRDDDFRVAFQKYSARTAKLGFYIIATIENYLAKGSGVMVQAQSGDQNLEHIMPRNPGGEKEWSHLSDEPEYNSYVNRVGNLLVLEGAINKSIKNKGLLSKIGVAGSSQHSYLSSKLRLPLEVGNYLIGDTWSFQSIDDRQARLANLAVEVWNLETESC